jgi:TPR repeat protein
MERGKGIMVCAALLVLVAGLTWKGLQAGTHSVPEASDSQSEPGRAPPSQSPHPAARLNRADADYQTAVWLLPRAQELASRSDAGDAEASYELSLIYGECVSFFDPTQDEPTGMPPDRRPALYRSGAWLSQRCDGIDRQDAGEASFRYRRRAAEQGHFAAQIIERYFGGMLQGASRPSTDEQVSIIEKALARNDGQAYLALSEGLSYDPGGVHEALAPYPAGTDVDAAAWMLAACDAGVPCGADSVLLHELCGTASLCGEDSVEAALGLKLSPEELVVARQKADALAIRSRDLRGRR